MFVISGVFLNSMNEIKYKIFLINSNNIFDIKCNW